MRVISDKERRRAVAELREASTGAYRHVDSLDVIANSVGVEVDGKFSREVENEIYAALADFIDRPTCKIVYSAQLHTAFGEPIAELEVYGLSCGHQAVGPEKPGYCPKCGEVIVDED